MELEARKISLFFFFATLDEPKSINASIRALRILKRRVKSLKGKTVNSHLVSVTNAVWNKQFARRPKTRTELSEIENFEVPVNTDLRPWIEFQRLATEPELLSLVWNKILNIKEEEIASGLDLQPNVIHHRVARALRKLGGMNQVGFVGGLKGEKGSWT